MFKQSLQRISEKSSFVGPLLARVTVGWIMAEAGWGKLHHLDKVIAYFGELGIPAPHLQAPFVACVELIGGCALLVGIFTRLSSIPLACTMVVAIVTAKKNDVGSFSDLFGLSEFLYLVLLIWLGVAGAGKLSLDTLLRKRKTS